MAEVSDRQRRAIEALLSTKSTSEAATVCGVGARTIERWKRDQTFRDAFRAASRDRLAETVGRLRGAASEAVNALRDALSDERVSNRIRAASVLLETAVKVEIDDLARRVEALEATQQQGGQWG